MIKDIDEASPIPALDVDEREPAMSLARQCIKIPERFVFRNRHGHLGDLTITVAIRDEHFGNP